MPEPSRTTEFQFTITSVEQGQRLDKFLAVACSPGLSRSQLKQLILSGRVTVNNAAVKPHYLVANHDAILVRADVPAADPGLAAVFQPLDILFEDEYLIAVNKPAGMVVHPAAGHRDDTLVNALLFHCRSLAVGSSPEKPGIVHRLDKDTSGVLLAAKDNHAFRQLSHQFRQRLVKKVYCAIVVGSVEFDEGVIDAPLGRSPLQRMQMRVMHDSPRHALTRYRTITRGEQLSVLEVMPHTGRTHQIRVHLASIGYPVLGDALYGRNKGGPVGLINRQALHAQRLTITHPYLKTLISFEAPIPADMQRVIDMIA